MTFEKLIKSPSDKDLHYDQHSLDAYKKLKHYNDIVWITGKIHFLKDLLNVNKGFEKKNILKMQK